MHALSLITDLGLVSLLSLSLSLLFDLTNAVTNDE
jgi:hypothetical protein